ncbi:MAG: cysteate synthase [Alphaproteobacteria bacterium]
MSEFKMRCQHAACGTEYSGAAGFRLSCDHDHEPALLLPVYENTQLTVRPSAPGIFKFADWLPTNGMQLAQSRYPLGEPFCYRSYGLARRLGLKRLYIAFSGYWPERGPNLVTRTFKEFEVQCSLAYFLTSQRKTGASPLAIASAGNTGNSFNFYAALMGFPIYLFVPETGLDNLVLPFATSPFLVAVKGDYSDAIAMADAVAKRVGFSRDGGVLNVGRRAGMATVMLNAVTHPEQGSGRLFDHYFQGVGSGSGAIAAWEAVQMLLRDGRFGSTPTKIHMAQNSPFTPIADSWESGETVIIPENDARDAIANVTAKVLTNRKPPYEVAGGLRDALTASKGQTWRVSNQRLFHAARLFNAEEGIDIGSASAVGVDALRQAVEAGAVNPDDAILLHIKRSAA